MKIILFGLGSIGMRYARLLSAHFPEHSVIAFRSSSSARNELGIKEIHSWEEVKAYGADCAFITNPTYLHIETALKCAELGMSLFIEKPIGSGVEGLDGLLNIVREKGLASYIAYCMRFHPTIMELKHRLSGTRVRHSTVICASNLASWRPGRDHLKAYSSYKGKGGGVILELSHEFDYSEYLFGKVLSIDGKAGKGSDVTVDAEDWADAIIGHETGNFTNVHVNFFSDEARRVVEADTDSGYFRADLITGRLEHTRAGVRQVIEMLFDRDAMFIEQMKYFFGNIHNKGMMNSLGEAEALFRKIITYREKALLA